MFFDRFSRNPQMLNFMTIPPVGFQLSHVDGQTGGRTDMTKLIVAFHNCANAPKNDKRESNYNAQKKEKVYLPSLRMKVPDHVYVFGSLLLQ
jgi:hypothetical protein